MLNTHISSYIIDHDIDVLDLILLESDTWNYLLSTPQFEEYLQDMADSENWSIEEARKYIEEDGWDEVKDFVLKYKGIQEYLNKNLTIDFNEYTHIKLVKESS